MLGGGQGDQHEITILNRRLRWTEKTIEYEADQKHALEIIREMGLESESKGLEAPYEKEEVKEGEDREEQSEFLSRRCQEVSCSGSSRELFGTRSNGHPVSYKRDLSTYGEADR